MKQLWIIFTLLLLILVSCEEENLSTYKVVPQDFRNTVKISGYTEPVKSTNVTSGRLGGSSIAYIIEDGTFVKKGDTLVILESSDLLNNYDEESNRLESFRSEIGKTKADLKLQYTLLEAQIENNDADTKIARLDSAHLDFYTANQRKIKELELKKTSITKARYDKKLKSLAFIQQSEIRKLELQIQQAENSVNSLKGMVNSLTITSPSNGLATRLISRNTRQKFKVGDKVWNNTPLVAIPVLETMKVKMQASEQEFKSINIKDSISYTFDAMPNNIANGKITTKLPVGKEYKQGSKVKFFEIEATIDSTGKIPDPGFTVNCEVFLKEVIDTIVIPQIAVFDADSMKVVYVKKEKGYEMRQVKLGISSQKEIVIEDGLKRYEDITLMKPKLSSITTIKKLADSISK